MNTGFQMGRREEERGIAMAPASLRMMGKSGARELMEPATVNAGVQDIDANAEMQATDMPGAPASVPAERKSQGQGQGQGQGQMKQFHRKSLGDWDFLETVGAGSMGKVKLAKHRRTGEVCAIKIVNRATKAFLHKEQNSPPPVNNQEIMERQKKLEKEISRDKRAIREASLGQIFYHPHICRLFEMCTMSNHFYMLFEYVAGGQLLDYIIQHGSLREHHARKFARGVASALQYLHANNIVHRDLKIENIMISNSGEIKIIDFGLSNVYDTRKQLHTFCGSLYFAAPELLKAHPYTGPEVDVWSFGVVLYVLVCGKVPFDDENSSVLHEKIKRGKVEYPQHLSIEVMSLLSKMLVVDPSRRASLKQVVEHPWMTKGYDTPAPSYVPNRIPLTPEMLDSTVLREMFRLEFIEDIEETRKLLATIVSDPTYLTLSNEYWTRLQSITETTGQGKTTHFEIQGVSINFHLTSGVNKIPFEDPTRAFHPLLSIYYLVAEMLQRKMAKLQKKQALIQQQQQQIQKQQQQRVQQQQPQQQKQPLTPKEPEQTEFAYSKTPNTSDKSAGLTVPSRPTDIINEMKAKSDRTDYIMNTPKQDTGSNTTVEKLYTPKEQQSVERKTAPLHIMVPPKLTMPEQAHTSPTTRKSSDIHDELNTAMSPKVLSKEYEQRPNTQLDSPEKKRFPALFGKLSQKRQPSSQQSPQSNNNPQFQVHAAPNLEPAKRSTKTHTRTVSEYVPGPSNNKEFIETYLPSNYANKNNSPSRSVSTKVANTERFPALPANANTMVEQQLAKDMDNLNVNNNTNRAPDTSSADYDENKPLPPLTVTKGRKLHPSARAKSVGHSRRESLKFTRPPVPTNVQGYDNDDAGFLEYSDDNRNDSAIIRTPNSSKYLSPPTPNTRFGFGSTEELTDEQILEQASRAPPGTMPSIDYPRSLFLKGFFSVQTTSSKPLPIVRYKIMHLLKKMHVEFKEVKGGFVCTHEGQLSFLNNDNELPEYNPLAETDENNIDNRLTINTNLSPHPSQNHLQLPTPIENQAVTYRSIRSGSRQNSIRRQGSTKISPNIPTTPMATTEHHRNISEVMSPVAQNINLGSTLSDEHSTTSLDNIANQEDILTTSRVQNMNRPDLDLEQQAIAKASNEKSRVKFEIHIVKVRIVGLAGVHFKKVSGNTWLYKELASHILKNLNL